MNWITDEFLFYGGIIIVAISLLLLGIYLCIAKIKGIRLQSQLEKEYGENNKIKKEKK